MVGAQAEILRETSSSMPKFIAVAISTFFNPNREFKLSWQTSSSDRTRESNGGTGEDEINSNLYGVPTGCRCLANRPSGPTSGMNEPSQFLAPKSSGIRIESMRANDQRIIKNRTNMEINSESHLGKKQTLPIYDDEQLCE
jgi:hypothetical protein